MGKTTDHLVDMAMNLNESPSAREMDMLLSTGEQVSISLLAMAIDSLGEKAISLTGAQCGIRTDAHHKKARIESIDTERIVEEFERDHIVIVAGFQGISDLGDITTLGRGGSDTTAVALAAAVKAEKCEIYTDVDGVFTTDPRKVAQARQLSEISYDE
ncbi:aspartate kinase, partial [Aduncisulcus paluster]